MVISPFVGLYVEFVLGARHHIPALRMLPGYGFWDADKVNGNPWGFWGQRLLTVVGVTTVCWIIVTLLTRPTEMGKLKQFYLKVRPLGPGWRYVRRQCDNPPPFESGWLVLRIWLTGLMLVLGAIVAGVEFIRGHHFMMAFWVVVAVAGFVLLKRGMGHADGSFNERVESEVTAGGSDTK